MRILAFDPGKENFAWALLDKGKCVGHGFIRTMTDLRDDHVQDALSRFAGDTEALLDRHKPDFVAIERMQHRPKFGGGAVVEYINIMIGDVIEQCRKRGIRFFLYRPVTWKTHMIKLFEVDKTRFTMATQKLQMQAPKGKTRKYKGKIVPVKKVSVEIEGVLAPQPGAAGLTPHEADAIGIAAYCWRRITGIDVVQTALS